ncbi:hypothetical protein ACHQM5_001802 [Ranunculus cassubicifolius]
MFSSIAVLIFAFLAALWFIWSFKPKPGQNGLHLPPGPWGYPILGHLPFLGEFPHRTLQSMAKTYGSIMYIRLGQVPTIVASSPEFAELFFKTHDLAFADRPNLEASKYMGYGRKGLIFAPYGSYWRNVRKICTLELLSNSKIDMFRPSRKKEIVEFIEKIKIAAETESEIDITAMVGSLVENMTYLMLFGFKDDRFNLKSSIHEVVSLTGVFNIADYIPFLKQFDFQGCRDRMRNVSKTIDDFLEMIIDEHEQDANSLQGKHRDFIDVLLSLMDSDHTREGFLDRDSIKAILLDLLCAGMDTSVTTIEWTIAELLKHPRVMELVQEELKTVVGLDRIVEEADLVNLKYLKMVVKESMRLHPVVPLIVHQSMEDVSIQRYFIPKKSRIMLNLWAVGRDPNVWSSNAQEFYPERFVGGAIDLQGQDFQLLPFGSGRRKCAGLQLGLTVVEFIVAQLVHCFNLKLPHGILHSDLDMNEKFGLTLPRANHVVAIPTYRLVTK